MKRIKQFPSVVNTPHMHQGQVFTLRQNYLVMNYLVFLSCRCGIWGAYCIKLILNRRSKVLWMRLENCPQQMLKKVVFTWVLKAIFVALNCFNFDLFTGLSLKFLSVVFDWSERLLWVWFFNTQLKTGLMAIVTLVSLCYKIVLLFTDVKKNTITHQLWESLPAPSSRLPSLTWNFCLFLISSMVWFPSNTSMALFVYF